MTVKKFEKFLLKNKIDYIKSVDQNFVRFTYVDNELEHHRDFSLNSKVSCYYAIDRVNFRTINYNIFI